MDRVEQVELGQVRTVLCSSPVEGLAVLSRSDLFLEQEEVVMGKLWQELPQPGTLTQECLEILAETALAFWPNWYGQVDPFHSGTHSDQLLLDDLKCRELQQKYPDFSRPWTREAMARCRAGYLPLLRSHSRALQIAQLSLAIAPGRLYLMLALEDPSPPSDQLLALTKGLLWLAHMGKIGVVLLIHKQLSEHSALESVLYGAIPMSQLLPEPHAFPQATQTLVPPIRGKPHPFSQGEQILAEKLSSEPELGPLFSFNQTVKTVRGSRFCVDLLWPEGRVIVEIDGYRYHGNSFSFSLDRNRDYELIISDYLVLRLPHDEVLADLEIAIEKIRDVVRFRQEQIPKLKEVRS